MALISHQAITSVDPVHWWVFVSPNINEVYVTYKKNFLYSETSISLQNLQNKIKAVA